MVTAIKSLYVNVSACVKVNNLTTGWFDVNSGLRQGCSLLPLLFNLYINDIAIHINALGKGVTLKMIKYLYLYMLMILFKLLTMEMTCNLC